MVLNRVLYPAGNGMIIPAIGETAKGTRTLCLETIWTISYKRLIQKPYRPIFGIWIMHSMPSGHGKGKSGNDQGRISPWKGGKAESGRAGPGRSGNLTTAGRARSGQTSSARDGGEAVREAAAIGSAHGSARREAVLAEVVADRE